jgi:hypothetical protein
MPFEIRVFTNVDDATVVWRPDTFVPGCRGFALMDAAAAADRMPNACSKRPPDAFEGGLQFSAG